MERYRKVLLLLAVLASTGCVSQSQFLDSKQGMATQTVMNRAKFEMNCQEVTPTIISREVVEPALQGAFVNGIERAEYTIGIAGCGKRETFIVICPDGGEGCYSTGPGGFHNW